MTEKQYQINCPECGGTQTVTLHDKIDAPAQPRLKEALFNGTFNQVTCSACEFKFRTDLPLLYTDMPNEIIIHWIPPYNQSLEDIQASFNESFAELKEAAPAGAPLPRLQLVLSRVELIERILILEEKLNEEIIEYIKHTLHSKNPTRIPAQHTKLILNTQDSDDENLVFAMQDINSLQFEDQFVYPRIQYDKLIKEFKHDREELDTLFPGAYKNGRLSALKIK